MFFDCLSFLENNNAMIPKTKAKTTQAKTTKAKTTKAKTTKKSTKN